MDSVIWTPKLVTVNGPIIPCPAIEDFFGFFDGHVVKELKIALGKSLKDRILMMSGSLANFSSKALQDLLWGKTAYAGETTLYGGLWAAALDDTFNGATASEAGYTSYARLALTNNSTIFAAGTGTGIYTKTFPSDATKSFATSTGSTATCTYFGWLNGNAGSSADKGIAWASISSVTINVGDTPQVAQNAFSVAQD